MRACILVIDDQLFMAQATARLLQMDGHNVRIETDGWKALKILESQEEFDVTFLDVLMPDFNGNQIYNRIRTTAPARLNRLVFLTGMGLLAEVWLRSTGVPVVEKGTADMAVILRDYVCHFAELDCPRGPHPVPKRTLNHPGIGSDTPESDKEEHEEVTEITKRALRGDPMATKVKEHDEAIGELKSHFKDHHSDPNKRGVVMQTARDVSFLKTFLTKFVPLSLPVIVAMAALAWWLVQRAAPPPPPPEIDYEKLGHEMAKHQQK